MHDCKKDHSSDGVTMRVSTVMMKALKWVDVNKLW